MDYKARIDKLTQFQTFCVIPIVVLNLLPRSAAVDQQRAMYSALFRLGVSVLCIAVMIALEVQKFKLRKAAKAEASVASSASEGVQYPRES